MNGTVGVSLLFDVSLVAMRSIQNHSVETFVNTIQREKY